MSNRSIAEEWISMAKKNLETAELLLKVHHYTDVIAIEIHQTIEKSVKALFAFNGTPVPRIRYIPKLMDYAASFVDISDIDEKALFIINDYYLNARYPGPKYFLPSEDEISQNLRLAKRILNSIQAFIDHH
ncbi:HEPN domain-containing protein [Anaerophaga thermohalophila]|uniref:HEPN domain-containing protein n=1 Tax=Anaerophaga thermohalophila TaxID=177400 RepID=UPI000364CEE0|nr:HEPN domain-containing protein [Anaerophaga thermohalophila]